VPSASNVAEVEAIKGRLRDAAAALLTEYRGLTVKDLGELRASLRGSQTEYKVLKNTLTAIAAREVGYAELESVLQGPTAVAFVHGDPVQAAKDLADFARSHPALLLKGGVMDGRVLDADGVRTLATMESREVLLARMAGMLQGSLQQTVNLLAAPLRQVATMTAALRDQRQAAEPAAPAEAAKPEPEAAEPEPEAAVPAEAAEPEPEAEPEAAAEADQPTETTDRSQ
jgi:large subunit ribosomal protein L10